MTYQLHERLHKHVDAMAAHRFTLLLLAIIYVPLLAGAIGYYFIVGECTTTVRFAAVAAACIGVLYVLELICYLWHRRKAQRIETKLIEIRNNY